MFKRWDKKAHINPINTNQNIPGTSRDPGVIGTSDNDTAKPPRESLGRRCCRYMYDREKKTFCGRTCKSWGRILAYSIMYIIFLSTYTMIFLFGSLAIIKYLNDYESADKIEPYVYATQGIGLSATPTSVNSYPIIWYRNDPDDYQKYIDSLEGFLVQRRKREESNVTDLGPCGTRPFGYGDSPCVIIRINKRLGWNLKPMSLNSTKTLNLPLEVEKRLLLDKQKLWLHCDGVHSYDKQHIGNIKYHPDPPGYDPDLFPLDIKTDSPLIAVQFSGFTQGISLAVECKLWYEGGMSTIDFLLYVTPKKK